MRIQKLRTLLVCCLVLVLASCKWGSQGMKSAAETNKTKIQMEPPIESAVAVGRCRIVASIVSIDTAEHTCLQYPCRAKAVIKELKGYGSAFGSVLSVGQEISLVFEFGLAPLTRPLANGTLSLRGLTAGETFKADIQGGGGESAGGSSFTVFEYSK